MKYQKEDITKSYYENTSFNFLKRDEMAAVLISGENYKEYTAKFQKPYDNIFISSMQKTLVNICSAIPTCVLGFTKEFDIVVFFDSPDTFEKTSWYNYDINKIATLTSSMATLHFNKTFEKNAKSYVMSGNNFDETRKFTAMQGYVSAIDSGAFFTSRCFNIKADKIADYIFLLQKETIENAVHEMGLQYFKETELTEKSASEIQLMVFDKAGTNFDNYPAAFKRGTACVKNVLRNDELIDPAKPEDSWVIDNDFPLLKQDNRSFIEQILNINQ